MRPERERGTIGENEFAPNIIHLSVNVAGVSIGRLGISMNSTASPPLRCLVDTRKQEYESCKEPCNSHLLFIFDGI